MSTSACPPPVEELPGFTPLFDTVVLQLGHTAATVYGAIWRKCQMRDHVCRASQHKLAGGLGLSAGTVNREIRKLVAAGYIEDLTPDVRRAPHAYRDTGRAMQVAAPARTPDVAADRETVPCAQANPPQADDAVPQLNTTVAPVITTVPLVNTTVAPVNTTVAPVNTTVSLAHSKILIRDSIRDSREGAAKSRAPAPPAGTAAAPPARTPDPDLALFRQVTGFAPPRPLHSDVAQAFRSIERRLGHPLSASDLAPYFKSWLAHGWRPVNLAWLFEWAVAGAIPVKGVLNASTPQRNDPRALPAEERERLVRLYNRPRVGVSDLSR